MTVADDQQAHTLFVQFEAGRITKGSEQDVIMRMMAQGNPDTMVTLSQTVNEQETGTKVNIKESTIFAMRMCPEQISHNKYFAACVAETGRGWSMPEVSRLMRTNSVQVVDFDMCRFGHPDTGPMSMLTISLQVAKKAHRKGPPAAFIKGNRREDSGQLELDICALQSNPCRHRRPKKVKIKTKRSHTWR